MGSTLVGRSLVDDLDLNWTGMLTALHRCCLERRAEGSDVKPPLTAFFSAASPISLEIEINGILVKIIIPGECTNNVIEMEQCALFW